MDMLWGVYVHGEDFFSGIFRKASVLVDMDKMILTLRDNFWSKNSERVIGNHFSSKHGDMFRCLLIISST
jgi:hypothetical protein